MTSQIVLINQTGVAVASDTLVTLHTSPGHYKTYPSVNKIYPLGGNHNVVVLHSGRTALGGVQYELIIKEWFLTLTEAPLTRLESYVDNFVNFVEKWNEVEINESELVESLICRAFGEIEEAIPNEFLVAIKTSIGSGVLSDELQGIIAAGMERLREVAFDEVPYADLDEVSSLKILKQSIDFIEHFHHESHFGQFELNGELKKAVEKFSIGVVRHHTGWSSDSTLNFAGFGQDDVLGGVIELNSTSRYAGHLRGKRSERLPESKDLRPTWKLIAQQTAMDAFLTGVDNDFWDEMVGSFNEIVSSLDNVDSEQSDQLINIFLNNLRSYMSETYEKPIMRTINALSIGSLVKFADSLVRMQSLRSASTGEEGTVGGRIESLLISKTEGVHWYSRVTPESIDPFNSPHVFA